MVILFDAHPREGDCVEFAGCPCPEPRRRASRRIEIRRCGDERKHPETVRCDASEEWPDLYCGVFAAEAVLGDRRRHAEFDIEFGDETREFGPIFLLCRYRTEGCAGPRPDPFFDQPERIELPHRAIRRSAFPVSDAGNLVSR
jgi:hypothetical protein